MCCFKSIINGLLTRKLDGEVVYAMVGSWYAQNTRAVSFYTSPSSAHTQTCAYNELLLQPSS